MRKVAFSVFQKKFKKDVMLVKDSRVAVLLEHSGYWWKLSEHFRQELSVSCKVFYLEMDYEKADWHNQTEKVCRWKPDVIVGIGGFEVLQRTCWLRNVLPGEMVPVLLFSGKDRWKLLEKESLWIRNQEGETIYWGYQREQENDLLVLTDEVVNQKESETEPRGIEMLGRAVAIWQRGIDNLLAEEQDLGWSEKKRTLLEELAEPLRIRYGIPMEIGIYYGVLYVYRQLTEKQKQRLCTYCKVKITEGCWHLEKIAHQVCTKELTGTILPVNDIFLLTQMAMEGIENLPPQQQLSWKQVETFYHQLC